MYIKSLNSYSKIYVMEVSVVVQYTLEQSLGRYVFKFYKPKQETQIKWIVWEHPKLISKVAIKV